jgi:hypothetical protein
MFEDESNHVKAVEVHLRTMRERVAVLEERIAQAVQVGEPTAMLTAALDKAKATLSAMESYRQTLGPSKD